MVFGCLFVFFFCFFFFVLFFFFLRLNLLHVFFYLHWPRSGCLPLEQVACFPALGSSRINFFPPSAVAANYPRFSQVAVFSRSWTQLRTFCSALSSAHWINCFALFGNMYIHYLQKISDDFNFGQKWCQKIKPSEIFKRPKFFQYSTKVESTFLGDAITFSRTIYMIELKFIEIL